MSTNLDGSGISISAVLGIATTTESSITLGGARTGSSILAISGDIKNEFCFSGVILDKGLS